MKRKIRGVVLIVLGLELMLFSAVVLGYYDHQAADSAQNAQILLVDLNREVYQNRIENIAIEAPENQMPQLSLNGYSLIGILKAEKAGIDLPIIDSWSYEKLKTAPCRYSGSLKTKDLVLIGHNYDGHLKTLDVLKPGDVVNFIDVSGKEHLFEVAETKILAPEQVDKLNSDDHSLIIVTCTSTGKNRFAIYCIEKHLK